MAVPYRLPWDVNVIRVNYRCLKPPHIYTDLDGYFCMPPVVRSIVATVMEAPKGFTSLPQPRAEHIAALPIMRDFDLSAYYAPPVFEFGVDIPFTAYKPS